MTMDKVAQAPSSELAKPGVASFRIETPELSREVIAFGRRVLTGPVRYDLPKAQVRECDAYQESLVSAPIGSSITFTLETIGGLTIKRFTQPAGTVKQGA